MLFVPNVLLAFWQYRRRVGIDLRIALLISDGYSVSGPALVKMLFSAC
jgi:hypothetical protein